MSAIAPPTLFDRPSRVPSETEADPRSIARDPEAEARIERAATNSMVVKSYLDAPGMFEVYNVRGESYIADIIEERCLCPDHERREIKCKHLYRVEMHLGLREIPEEFGPRCDARIMREIALRKKAEQTEAEAAAWAAEVAAEADREMEEIEREIAEMHNGPIGSDPDAAAETETLADGGREVSRE